MISLVLDLLLSPIGIPLLLVVDISLVTLTYGLNVHSFISSVSRTYLAFCLHSSLLLGAASHSNVCIFSSFIWEAIFYLKFLAISSDLWFSYGLNECSEFYAFCFFSICRRPTCYILLMYKRSNYL